MNYNSFKLAGRYIHKYKDNDNHYIILIALMYPINKKRLPWGAERWHDYCVT